MMQPCCVAYCDHPYKNNDDAQFKAVHISEGCYNFFRSEQMKQLRKDMQKEDPLTPLVRDVCRNCIAMEEQNIPSIREPLETPVLFGRVLDVKMKLFGNACNLQCFMCNPKNSSGRLSQAKKLIEYNPDLEQFLYYDNIELYQKENSGYDLAIDDPKLFESQIENIKKISNKIKHITVYGGEPFLLQSHYKLLDALIEVKEAKNISLTYDSNMTVLHWAEHKVIDYVKQFKDVIIEWSVEGVGEYNNYIRFPSKWDNIIKNINEIRPHLHKFNASITLSALSVLHLDKLVEWLNFNQITYRFNFVINPKVCRIDALHPSIRKKLVDKYRGTDLDFLCKTLSEDVSDWEIKWKNFLNYIEAIDYVNRTDYKKTFPELCNLS